MKSAGWSSGAPACSSLDGHQVDFPTVSPRRRWLEPTSTTFHYLDLETGEVLMVTEEIRGMLDKAYEEVGEGDVAAHVEGLDLPAWMKEAILVLRPRSARQRTNRRHTQDRARHAGKRRALLRACRRVPNKCGAHRRRLACRSRTARFRDRAGAVRAFQSFGSSSGWALSVEVVARRPYYRSGSPSRSIHSMRRRFRPSTPNWGMLNPSRWVRRCSSSNRIRTSNDPSDVRAEHATRLDTTRHRVVEIAVVERTIPNLDHELVRTGLGRSNHFEAHRVRMPRVSHHGTAGLGGVVSPRGT